MTEEDVIRRRLLIDGDGTGDDRRLNVLLKNLIKWCGSTNETPEESKAILDKMLGQLAQCEFAVTKSQLGSRMMGAELDSYEGLSHIIEKEILAAKEHIQRSKVQLKLAQTVRKNRIQYDVLAKDIALQPDRKETQDRLSHIQAELRALQATRDQLERKLALRKKQFHVLLSSVQQLQALLDEGEPDDILTVSLDDVDMASS